MNRFTKMAGATLVGASLVALTGCQHSDDDADHDHDMDDMVSYEVKVINLTSNQPMTPVAIVAHENGYHMWQLGSAANGHFEYLAEGGDTSHVIGVADSDAMVVETAVAGTAPFTPGASVMADITLHAHSGIQVTVASMLANTNDGFAGATVDISGLAMGESVSMMMPVYDAGTEANTETAATLPGMSGEGYNAARDDLHDVVTVHAGVVSSDDGLSTSALNESHRWNGPAAKLVVTRK